ncbi:SseB protein N-terminal domain-containing protein [Sporobacter termitidis DSM 10068]|uniref:SseB protein N-terminal domain-containing protein n=2 Tax=Sporobacter TaxID=44748 RepID=A0A1M5WMP4_9FIRM|nr:SseB protein N-terminal domain-containing protein [Sporobacter termitidis DSM 10068]
MLAAMISPAGDRYLSAFTHPGELAQWPFDNNKTVLLSFDELKLEVLNNPKKLAGIVIDPFSKMLLLDQELIEQIDMLTEGFGIRRVEHSRDLQLTRPAKVMPALIEELSVFLSGKENVYSAYMLMAREPDDPQPRLLFIIDFDGEKSELFPDLTKLICPYINQDETFEMMKATYELLEAAALKSAPVYKKP